VVDAAIAATDSQIGLAWLERYDSSALRLRFAWFGPDLTRIASTVISDPNIFTIGGPQSITLAPLASGWVIGGYDGRQDFFVHAIDASGVDLGRSVAGTSSGYDITEPPVLVSRPTGGPLFAWQQAGVVHTALVADDGRSVGPVKDVYGMDPSTASATLESAAFAGDAFYLLMLRPDAQGAAHYPLVRVEADGTPGAVSDALPGVAFGFTLGPIGSPVLVAGAADVRVLFGATGALPAGSYLRRAGATGASAPTLVSADYAYPVSAVAFGDDTVALVGTSGADGNPRLALARLGPDGGILTAAHEVFTGPGVAAGPGTVWTAKGFARRGPEVVAAPLRDHLGELALARLLP
jgi:hypothetical protein